MLVRRALGERSARALGDRLVRRAPQKLQRTSEALFDYPICKVVRASRLLLIRIPRNASTSTAHHIYGTGSNIPHRTALFYKNSDPHFFSRVTSLAIIRNPWDRAVSAYEFLRNNGTYYAPLDPQSQKKARQLKSFEHYLYEYLLPNSNTVYRLDPTSHPQFRYVCDETGEVIVDHLFRFEELDSVSCFLREKGGMSANIPHLNQRGLPDHWDFRSYYGRPGQVEVIGTVYKEDIELFGYSWE